jgi:hypothetical protein
VGQLQVKTQFMRGVRVGIDQHTHATFSAEPMQHENQFLVPGVPGAQHARVNSSAMSRAMSSCQALRMMGSRRAASKRVPHIDPHFCLFFESPFVKQGLMAT